MGFLFWVMTAPIRRALAAKTWEREERRAAGEDVFPLSPRAVFWGIVIGAILLSFAISDIYTALT